MNRKEPTGAARRTVSLALRLAQPAGASEPEAATASMPCLRGPGWLPLAVDAGQGGPGHCGCLSNLAGPGIPSGAAARRLPRAVQHAPANPGCLLPLLHDALPIALVAQPEGGGMSRSSRLSFGAALSDDAAARH
jgi:hypothetical protein